MSETAEPTVAPFAQYAKSPIDWSAGTFLNQHNCIDCERLALTGKGKPWIVTVGDRWCLSDDAQRRQQQTAHTTSTQGTSVTPQKPLFNFPVAVDDAVANGEEEEECVHEV
jgi:hypothetical protein